MMNTCPLGTHCCWIKALLGIVWLLGASGLLFLTWNKVVCDLTKLKRVKYWQPLLVLSTICALCIPCAMRHRHHERHMGGDGGCHHGQCQHCNGGSDDGDQDEPAKKK